jgi:hypothetical protein
LIKGTINQEEMTIVNIYATILAHPVLLNKYYGTYNHR